MLVATVLDLQRRTGTKPTCLSTVSEKATCRRILHEEDSAAAVSTRVGPGEQAGQPPLLAVSDNQVGTEMKRSFRISLRKTAGHHHPSSLRDAPCSADRFTRVGLPGGGDAAGIDHRPVGPLPKPDRVESLLPEGA